MKEQPTRAMGLVRVMGVCTKPVNARDIKMYQKGEQNKRSN